jgi:hypothetical protein
MPVSKPVNRPEPKELGTDGKQLESEVLSAIAAEAHRPRAIVNILRGKYDQNAIVKALIALEKDGKAERDGNKAWVAKGKAATKGKDSKKEKEKPKKE